MKKLIYFIIFSLQFTFLVGLSSLMGQTLTISPGPLGSAQCPSGLISYTAGGAGTCTYTWSITGGSFQNNISVGNPIFVNWNDSPGTGTLSVTTSNCSIRSENNRTSGTVTYTRMSVAGQNFTNATCNVSNIDVPFCSTSSINVCVDQMFIQQTGGTNQPPLKEVDRYLWFIPTGWKQTGTSNNGPITLALTSNSISLEPTSANGGTITVRGSVQLSCSQTSLSNQKNITITRTPPVSISPPSGFVGARCGLTDPFTFTATSLPCATGYTWTNPSGWSGSSTTNSITLTPNGDNGGTLAVTINLSTGGVIQRSFNINFINTISNPTLTKSSNQTEICSGESWTFTCTQPDYPTNYGFDWYATGGLLIDGVATSSSSPLHTTTNQVTVSANSGSFGSAYIAARVNRNNGVCNPSNYVYIQTQVGPFSSSQFSISGPSTTCPNTTPSYLSTLITPGITDYQWGWSGFSSASGQGTPYLTAYAGPSFTFGTVILRVLNRCGLTGSPAIKYVTQGYCGGGYGYSLSPNPSNETLSVSIVDEETQRELEEEELPSNSDNIEVTLVNNRSKVVAEGKLLKGKIEFNVSTLPNGLYIIRIIDKDRLITKQVLIKH